jgi:hypothetical protein
MCQKNYSGLVGNGCVVATKGTNCPEWVLNGVYFIITIFKSVADNDNNL